MGVLARRRYGCRRRRYTPTFFERIRSDAVWYWKKALEWLPEIIAGTVFMLLTFFGFPLLFYILF